jgi:competence protein ComEC
MDEIKRKLALIDAEVHRPCLYAQAVEAAPLLFPAVGLMVGIIGQEILLSHSHGRQSTVFLWFWTAVLTLGAASVAGSRFSVSGKWRSPVLACSVLICCTCLGAIRLISFHTAQANDVRYRVGDEQVLATVRGQIITEPHMGEPNWCFGQLVFEDPASRFYLSLDAVKAGRNWTPTTGTVHVRVDEPTPNLKPGDYVTAACWLHRFPPPSNPGAFDIARHLSRMNVYVGAAIASRDAIMVDRRTRPDGWARLRSWMSQTTTRALLGDARIDDPDEGLVQALLLGSRLDIDPRTYEAFRRTGLLHLVSLSGMNFAMLIAMIWWACRVMGLSQRRCALVGLVATAVFLMVVPPRAPTLRAAIIVWAGCVSILLGQRLRSLNSLCLAAIILLLIQPTQLFEAGWQLSFGCMAGIVALTERLSGWMSRPALELLSQPASPPRRIMPRLQHICRDTIRLFATGLAAWIGGAGILLYHFHTITPLTSLWTVLTFVLVWLIMAAGFLQILLAFLLPTISLLLGDFAQLLARVFIVTVRVMAIPDVNLLLVGHVGLWLVVLYYGLVLFWRFGFMKRVAWKRWLCLGMLFALVGQLGVLKWQRTHRSDLALTCLDVGHGQAILAQLPGTRNVLFDAGSLYKRDIGTRVVVPLLDYMGIGKLDAVVISHGDVDHINGIPEIAEHCRIGHLYATNTFLSADANEQAPALLIRRLHELGHTIEPLPERMSYGPAVVRTVWPPSESAGTSSMSDNDQSAVSLIEFADVGVLLCSDIESFAQRQIMAGNNQWQTQIVVAPHHGSSATTDKGFLSYLHPRIVVCSCGRGEHKVRPNPAPAAIPQWLHTSLHGAIYVCIDAEGVIRVWSQLNDDRTGE